MDFEEMLAFLKELGILKQESGGILSVEKEFPRMVYEEMKNLNEPETLAEFEISSKEELLRYAMAMAVAKLYPEGQGFTSEEMLELILLLECHPTIQEFKKRIMEYQAEPALPVNE